MKRIFNNTASKFWQLWQRDLEKYDIFIFCTSESAPVNFIKKLVALSKNKFSCGKNKKYYKLTFWPIAFKLSSLESRQWYQLKKMLDCRKFNFQGFFNSSSLKRYIVLLLNFLSEFTYWHSFSGRKNIARHIWLVETNSPLPALKSCQIWGALHSIINIFTPHSVLPH